jgi:PAS domain S-box-containing protein
VAIDYRALFEDNPNAVVVFDRESRALLAVNEAACRHFGYPREELIGRDVATLRPAEDVERMVTAYAASRAQTKPEGPMPFPGVWRQQRKDGSIVHVEIWRLRIEYDGRPAVLAVITDVTERLRVERERMRAEEALRASEERFRALIENSSDTVSLLDGQGRIAYTAPSVRRNLGWEVEDLLGTEALEWVHPDDRAGLAERIAQMLRAPGSTASQTYRARHSDGSWRWIEGVATNLLHVPSVRAIVTNYRDVTARVDAERALRASEERYRQLFDAMPLPVFVFDSETHRYLAVNEAAVSRYGWSREEFLGMTIFDIRPPEDIPRLRETVQAIERRRPRPASVATGVWRHRLRDGTELDVEITTHPIEFAGRPARLVVAQDVTERRRLEEQLRQSQKMEATGMLAGGIAHDFNNLLGVVLGATELARRACREGRPADGLLAEVEAAATRAAELTRKLLAFSRKQVLRVRPIDLGDAVEDFLPLLRRVAGENVEVALHRCRDRLVVDADASQLEQVLLNLCTNARQAMPTGGRLALETHRTRLDAGAVARQPWAAVGDYAEVRVVDTGVGMDAATQAHVFEPFFTTKDDGTGLGLAMVHGIVHQHRGHVCVDSRPGAGTTVRVLLPLSSPGGDEHARPRTAPPPRQVYGGDETLLVAEDEPVLRSLLATTLSDLGYEVLTAEDGEQAAQLFEQTRDRVGLVILDVVMPRMGGVQAYERMRAVAPYVKAIFTTGYAPESAQVGDLVTRGGHALLTKPFSLDELGRKVRETLDETAGAAG